MARREAAISVRIEEKVKEALAKAAEEDDRTMSQFVERLIIAYLKETKRLPK